MADVPVPFLWLSGAAGVGKSTVAFEIFARLRSAGVPVARVELDDIGYLRQDPAADPGGHLLQARNLASMWPNFRAAGARGLIVSGVVSNREDIDRYRDAVPNARLTLCRLEAAPETLRDRILRRGRLLGVGTPGGITGFTREYLERQAAAVHCAERLDREDFADWPARPADLSAPDHPR
ncbi:MAG: AAA family ATPase [Mycobacteriales bacterium]